jgi:hypothetical protein
VEHFLRWYVRAGFETMFRPLIGGARSYERLAGMNFRRIAVASVITLAVAAGVGLTAQGGVGVPANLVYQVNGRNVFLNWTSSPGPITHYRLEAGDSPGTTFFTWDSNTLVDLNKLPQLLSRFGTSGVGNGNYYVRVRGVNGGDFSAPSNEVVVPITGGCQAPGAPTDFTAITRGDTVYLAWNPGSGGQPTSYVVHARYSSGGAIIASIGTTTANVNVGAVPTGTYFVQVFAATPCGTSPYSNEIVVNAPNGAAAVRTPDAASGRVPYFEVRNLVIAAGQEAAGRGLLNGAVSCPSRPGHSDSDIEARKTQRNAYIDYVVGRLRQFDQRFGYNAKPTRANAIVAGDEIAYHWGSDAPEGSPNVYLFDTLGGHCTFGRESVDFRPFFDEYGRWTAAGAF